MKNPSLRLRLRLPLRDSAAPVAVVVIMVDMVVGVANLRANPIKVSAAGPAKN